MMSFHTAEQMGVAKLVKQQGKQVEGVTRWLTHTHLMVILTMDETFVFFPFHSIFQY